MKVNNTNAKGKLLQLKKQLQKNLPNPRLGKIQGQSFPQF